MLHFQKAFLEDLFLDGLNMDSALAEIGAENGEQWHDAVFTWSRWQRELDNWGFYSY